MRKIPENKELFTAEAKIWEEEGECRMLKLFLYSQFCADPDFDTRHDLAHS